MSFTVDDGVRALFGLEREADEDATDLQISERVNARRLTLGAQFDALRYVTDLDRKRKVREHERLEVLRAADAKARRKLIDAEIEVLRAKDQGTVGGGVSLNNATLVGIAINALKTGPNAHLWASDRDAQLALQAMQETRTARPHLYAHLPEVPTVKAPTRAARAAKRTPADVARERLDRIVDDVLRAGGDLALDPTYAVTGNRARDAGADIDRALARLYEHRGRTSAPKIGYTLLSTCHGLEARRAMLRGHLVSAGIVQLPAASPTPEPDAKPAATMRERATEIASVVLEAYSYDERAAILERQLIKHGDRRDARRMLDAALRAGDERTLQSRELVRLLRGGAR